MELKEVIEVVWGILTAIGAIVVSGLAAYISIRDRVKSVEMDQLATKDKLIGHVKLTEKELLDTKDQYRQILKNQQDQLSKMNQLCVAVGKLQQMHDDAEKNRKE